jgi:hypothetical protein
MIATIFSYGIVLIFDYSNQNCTLDNYTSFINQNSSDFVSIFVTTMLTLGLIVFSGLSLSSAQDALRQSKKEQQIRNIENRLEMFYMPAQSTLKVAVEFSKDTIHFTKWTNEVSSYQRENHKQSTNGEEGANAYVAEKLKEVEKYRFLAKEKTCRSLIKFLYENESTENRLEFSNYIQEDIKDYLAKLYELKKK